MSQHFITSVAQELAICQEYVAGLSLSQLAKKHGVHPSTILKILKRGNVPRRSGRPSNLVHSWAMPEADVKRLFELHEQGLTGYQIASLLKVSYETVLRRLRRAGLKANHPVYVSTAVPANLADLLREQYAQGVKTFTQACANIGVLRETARKHVPPELKQNHDWLRRKAEITAAVIADYKAGETNVQALSDKHVVPGFSANLVRKVLIEAKLLTPVKNVHEDNILRAHEKGLSVRQISDKLRCSKNTVWSALRRHKLQPHEQARPTPKMPQQRLQELKPKVISDFKSGMSKFDIWRKYVMDYGVTPYTIDKMLSGA
jgi:DNA-binding CsgD family transcriptional regulator